MHYYYPNKAGKNYQKKFFLNFLAKSLTSSISISISLNHLISTIYKYINTRPFEETERERERERERESNFDCVLYSRFFWTKHCLVFTYFFFIPRKNVRECIPNLWETSILFCCYKFTFSFLFMIRLQEICFWFTIHIILYVNDEENTRYFFIRDLRGNRKEILPKLWDDKYSE